MRKSLAESGVEFPGNTCLLLLSDALDQPKSWVLAHNEYELTHRETNTLQKNLEKLLQGVPLPYVLGYWMFFGRKYKVTPDVLIPRPETELLVERAIQTARGKDQLTIADIGTGSGAIAVSLAAALPSSKVVAVDLSWGALKIAKENAHQLVQDQIHFVQADLMTAFNARFDLICANLPYIPTRILEELTVVQWEPRIALDGGENGLVAIHALLEQARGHVKPKATILLEVEENLGEETLQAAVKAFPNAKHHLVRDLAGRNRLVETHLV